MNGHAEEQTEVTVDGTTHVLASSADPQNVKDLIGAAAATSGTFVDLPLEGGRRASVLVGPRSRVMVITQTVEADNAVPALVLNEFGTWDLL